MKGRYVHVALAVFITLLLAGCIQLGRLGNEEGNGGGTNPDIAIEDVILEDSFGNEINADYEVKQKPLVVFPKDKDGNIVTNEDLAWVWRPDGANSDSSGDISLTPNPDGSITIPEDMIDGGNGKLVVTDSDGATDSFPIVVQKITITGMHDWVDVQYTHHGGHYSITLTAESTGITPVNLEHALWSSKNPSFATVTGQGATAIVEGVSQGSTYIEVSVTEDITARYAIEVKESTLITFDLSSASKETEAEYQDMYKLELPLMSSPAGTSERYSNWEYWVDWGDGNDEVLTYTSYNYEENRYPTHYYDEAKEYTIRIISASNEVGLRPWNFLHASVKRPAASEDFPYWNTRATGGKYLTDVPRFAHIAIDRGAFANCVKLVDFSAEDTPTVKDGAEMFAFSPLFNGDIGHWNMADVTSLGAMFFDASAFNQDISNWDIINVNNIELLFRGAKSFNNNNKPLAWGGKTQNIEKMELTFFGAESFNQDISSWNIDKVVNMNKMFHNAKAFNQDMSTWENWAKRDNVDGKPVNYNQWLTGTKMSTPEGGGSDYLPDGFAAFDGN